MRLRLSGREKRGLGGHGTQNAAAYELFLKARYLMVNDTEEDDLEARRLFQQALDRDPGFLEARLGIAATYARSAGNGYVLPREGWTRAREEAQKVLAVDPANVQARASLAAGQLMFDWDWPGAERAFRALVNEPRLLSGGSNYHPVAVYLGARPAG